LVGNPLVGTWNADVDANDPTNPPALFIFTSDGIYSEIDADGTTLYGAWKATGANTAELTALGYQSDQNGAFGGTITIRATITVGADGQSFQAPYTIEFTTSDGHTSGQAGPGLATGVRINPEPMGTPVMTIQEFQQVGAPATATP